MSKAQFKNKRPQSYERNDSEDEEQELYVKKSKNNGGGMNGGTKGKQNFRKEQSDSDSDSDGGRPQGNGRANVKASRPQDSDDSDVEEVKQAPQKGQNEVIIKGLPFASVEDDVQDFFESCGNVESVNLLRGPDGRSKGIAFIKFSDEKSVKKAIELSGSDLGGRSVTIEKTTPKEQRSGQTNSRDRPQTERDPNSTTVFVGNLSYSTSQNSIQSLFESCGRIKDVRLATDQEGNPRGFAYVEFASADSVEAAIQKTGAKLDGRAVRVDFTSAKKNDGGNRSFGGGRGGGRGGNRGGRGGRGGFRGGSRY